MTRSYFAFSSQSLGEAQRRPQPGSLILGSSPFSSAFFRAIATAASETSTAVTCSAPCSARVEREGARVREAVEHAAAPRQFCDGETVQLLVEEETGLCPFSKSTEYLTPFSTISVTVLPGAAGPRTSPQCGRPSASRSAPRSAHRRRLCARPWPPAGGERAR